MAKVRKKKKKSKLKRIILLTLLLIVTIFVVRFWIKTNENGGGTKGAIKTLLGYEKKENLEPINVLILGTNQKNTDTIMVASFNPKTNEASILSVPRDTFVGKDIHHGSGYDKINAIYANKGVDEMMKKVNQITGLNISKYVIIDTHGVKNFVDKIGGVEFDVPIDMNYHDSSQKLSIELKKGMQKLNGHQAEGVLRFRHNDDGSTYPHSYGIEDRGRNKTQQAFIKEMAKQTIQFHNITKVFELIEIANEHIETNIDMDTMKKYAGYALDFNPENIKTAIIPGKDIRTTAWFFEPNKEELKKIIFDLFVFSDDPRKLEFNKKEEENKENGSVENKENAEEKKEDTNKAKKTKNIKDVKEGKKIKIEDAKGKKQQ